MSGEHSNSLRIAKSPDHHHCLSFARRPVAAAFRTRIASYPSLSQHILANQLIRMYRSCGSLFVPPAVQAHSKRQQNRQSTSLSEHRCRLRILNDGASSNMQLRCRDWFWTANDGMMEVSTAANE